MFEENIHYSKSLEEEILGACLLENSAFPRIFGAVESENFYTEDHKIVFDVMTEMFDKNLPISLTSVADFSMRVKGIKTVNAGRIPFFLTKLTSKVTNTASLEYNSIQVKQMWIQRELVTLTRSGIKTTDTRKEISQLQDRLNELSNINLGDEWKDMSELMMDLYKHQDEMIKRDGKGIMTGFPTIDRIYGGFYPGQMIVIGARPSVGKSAFVGQMAMNMAAHGTRVGFISLEMSNNEIAARFAAIDTNTSFNKIFRGLYEDERDRNNFYNKINSSAVKLPIKVSDRTDLNVKEIKAKAYKLRYKHGLDCLIIDYLQLVDGENDYGRNRENEVSKISRGFKIIAKELNIPVIVPCQLNREVEKRKGEHRYPQLSDFRESGAIEQDADVAMFLHSDFKSGHLMDENNNSTENQSDIVIRKWRNGPPNIIIPLDFDGPKMKFKERSLTPNLTPVKEADKKQAKLQSEDPEKLPF